MEFKQIFDYNGTPYLVKVDVDGYVIQEELERLNITDYTDVMPPSNLYPPRYFDGEQWLGKSKTEWESENPTEPILPSDNDILNAQLLSNNLEHNMKIKSLQEDIANLTNELLKIKGDTTNVSNT
ncbi:hypothetical protein ABKP99_11055 [Mammaliicoccus sciuri]